MSIYKRGNSYQAKLMLGGTRYVDSFPSEVEAASWEARMREAFELGKPLPIRDKRILKKSGEVKTIQDLVRYVDTKQWSRNRAGEASVSNAVQFRDWTGPKRPVSQALDGDHIEEYLEWRKATKGNSGSTLNRHRAAISVLITHALKLGLIDRRPDLPRYPEGDARDQIFTDAQERQILQTLKAWQYEYEAMWLAFLADTGCRAGETRKLRWDDFRQLPNGAWVVDIPGSVTKSGKGRLIGLTPRAQEALQWTMERYRHEAGGPFEAINKHRMRTIWDRLRTHLDWLTDDHVLHTFRHTFASRVVQETGSLYLAGKALGHSNPITTQRYAKYTPHDMTRLAETLANRTASH
jgi:integrase